MHKKRQSYKSVMEHTEVDPPWRNGFSTLSDGAKNMLNLVARTQAVKSQTHITNKRERDLEKIGNVL